MRETDDKLTFFFPQKESMSKGFLGTDAMPRVINQHSLHQINEFIIVFGTVTGFILSSTVGTSGIRTDDITQRSWFHSSEVTLITSITKMD